MYAPNAAGRLIAPPARERCDAGRDRAVGAAPRSGGLPGDFFMHEILKNPRPAILIVDDEPAIRTLLTRWLRDAGYECLQAESAADAVELLASREISLITLDINMPGGSGLHLLDGISKQHPDTAVIMLTGERDTDVAVRASPVEPAVTWSSPWTARNCCFTCVAAWSGAA